MLKLKNIALLTALLVVLVLVIGQYPGAALASVPLGITLTPTEVIPTDPPTATPTTQETLVPPGPTETPTPTLAAPILTPTATEVPATPRSPRATPTTGAVLLPVTGELPPDSGSGSLGTLVLLFLVAVGLGAVSHRLGARVRKWLS